MSEAASIRLAEYPGVEVNTKEFPWGPALASARVRWSQSCVLHLNTEFTFSCAHRGILSAVIPPELMLPEQMAARISEHRERLRPVPDLFENSCVCGGPSGGNPAAITRWRAAWMFSSIRGWGVWKRSCKDTVEKCRRLNQTACKLSSWQQVWCREVVGEELWPRLLSMCSFLGKLWEKVFEFFSGSPKRVLNGLSAGNNAPINRRAAWLAHIHIASCSFLHKNVSVQCAFRSLLQLFFICKFFWV